MRAIPCDLRSISTAFWSLAAGVFKPRPFRVVLLISAIIAMSVIDLILTLTFVTQIGMVEVNPVARELMSYGSPFVITIWKLITVAIFGGILFLIRHKRSAEIGAWIGCALLGSLMVHWGNYVAHTQEHHVELTAGELIDDPEWILMPSDDTIAEVRIP